MRAKPSRAARRRERDRRALGLATGVAAVLLLLAAGALPLLEGPAGPREDAIGGPFTLTAGDGRTVTDRSFPGKYLVIYFGYTSCRDVCPVTLASLASALDRLGARAGRVQPIFVTVDPARDTPEVVRSYAASFTPRLIGLTGDEDQISQVTRRYRVSRTMQHVGSPAHEVVDHSSVLYLVGPDGRYLAPIPADETGPAMAAAIARHLS